ncbi:MAG: glycoside hydrolase family 55 protein [Candidatus Andersenbacteria bacterium]|nr:glycoside hydrolase family 55 protein [Candidatus Andersenbacteria bacterium]
MTTKYIAIYAGLAVIIVASVSLLFSPFRHYLGLTTFTAKDKSGPCQNAINVKDYGAKGDGSADDTKAIADASTASKTSVRASGAINAYIGSSDPICFPAGDYKISNELALKAYANIYGEGDVRITQSCASCNIFVFRGGYTITLRNIHFIGGKNQIFFENNNTDTTTVAIENSQFESANDYAIYTNGTSDGHLSAEISIYASKFINSRKVMRNVADHVIMRDSSIVVSKNNFDANSGAIWNRESSSIFFNNVTATANLNGVSQVRWVDNNGNFFVDKSIFAGENGGIPIVYQFGAPITAYPFMGKSVVIRNSKISAGSDTVIVLKEAVPQLVLMQGNTYSATHHVFSDAASLAGYIDAVNKVMPLSLKTQAFNIQVEDVSQANVPAALQSFVRK